MKGARRGILFCIDLILKIVHGGKKTLFWCFSPVKLDCVPEGIIFGDAPVIRSGWVVMKMFCQGDF